MTDEPNPQGEDAAGEGDPARRSIAVLPFSDLSAEQDQEHFCDGFSEEIIGNLSRIGGLQVATRASSFAFRGQADDPMRIGEKLEVEALVTGRADKAGEQLSVHAELVRVVDGERLWTEHFEATTKDVFAIQETIARRIADAFELHLTDPQLRAIGKAGTRDVEAYDFYLRGRQLFFRSNRKSIDAALEMFDRAIAKDASYALAYAGIAHCYGYLFMYFDPDPGNLKFARNASEHALRLDHESAEAHAARGLAVSLSQRYEEAEREFEEAIRLDPSLFEAHYFYARTCFSQSKYEEACRLYEAASRVNRDDAQALTLLAFTRRVMGQDDLADAASRQALGRLERHLELNPDDPRATYLSADALLQAGDREGALRRAERAASLDPDDPYTVYGLACIYSRLGEVDRGVAALESAVACGFGHKAWIVNDSDFDAIREDPRFQALVDALPEVPGA